MGRIMKVAAVQMDCLLKNREKNLHNACTLIEKAISQGAEMIVLPELFNTGYRVEEFDEELAETLDGYTIKWMKDIAKQYHVVLIGAILEKSDRVYDTAVIVNEDGLLGKYRKIHLWDKEEQRFAKGEDFPVFEVNGIKVGLQICYEVGFPEGARILSLKGAQIILYPSAFGKARLYAWDTATKARALENGIYVIACNRIGIEKEQTIFGGHSRIVDPRGSVIAETIDNPSVIVSEINMEMIEKQRERIPYLRDINLKLIKKEYENV